MFSATKDQGSAPDCLLAHPSQAPRGEIQVPGDKSISHRAAILGGMAEGDSRVDGFLLAEDTLASLAAIQALGVQVSGDPAKQMVIHGRGRQAWQAPTSPLDLGNSGTGIRLLSGALAGAPFATRLIGDASLSARPMGRIATPLRLMGAQIALGEAGTPPIDISPCSGLKGIDYTLPVASAQLKSALLLAGLQATGNMRIRQPGASRDHTERMLRACGVIIDEQADELIMHGGQALKGCDFVVPGDPSSSAFFVVAALLQDGARLRVKGVSVNPGRIGFVEVLAQMGAQIEIHNRREQGGEPVADLQPVLVTPPGSAARSLLGASFGPSNVASYIDELPILFVAAAAARGVTEFHGIEELRVKESDRITVMARGLRTLGIAVEEGPDWARITGGPFKSGSVDACGDHRCAMAFAVAASVAEGPVTIHGAREIATSYPQFVTHAQALGLRIEAHE